MSDLEGLELSPAAQQYLDDMPMVGGPAQVLANYFRRSRAEALAEKAAEQRRQDAEDARLEMVEGAAFRGQGLRDQFAPMHDFEIGCAVEEANEEKRRQAEQEARTVDLERRLAEAKEQLAKERKRSDRLGRNLSSANQVAAARRAQGDGGYRGVRTRNYWE